MRSIIKSIAAIVLASSLGLLVNSAASAQTTQSVVGKDSIPQSDADYREECGDAQACVGRLLIRPDDVTGLVWKVGIASNHPNCEVSGAEIESFLRVAPGQLTIAGKGNATQKILGVVFDNQDKRRCAQPMGAKK